VSSEQQITRRRIFKSAVGVAAVGAVGTAVLEPATPARAAELSTTVESGAIAPAVVSLADAPTIEVDASAGNDFRLTIAGNRMLATPTNPTDGQKITFQVTQGSPGSFTLSWDTGYEFAAALPQPTLSTTAGLTDLLGFIYNGDKEKWLFVAVVTGFAAPPPASPPAGTYRLFPTTDGPATPVSYSGPFIAGINIGATSGGCWLAGYWWWVCPSGQPSVAQSFALWCLSGVAAGSLIADGSVTSGTLTPGQWNYVPLSAPVPLAIGATYVAATGFTGSFPATNDQFGSGDPYGSGIVNGPLTAYSDSSGSLPSPFKTDQGVFSVASANPTSAMPSYGSNSANFWMDVQLTTTAPAGASYRLWPSYPSIPGNIDSDTTGYTLATEFELAQSCTLDSIWYYSAPGADVLPSRCGIWDVSSQSEVSGTDNSSPSWSGGPGSGWVSCSYSGVNLPVGDYKVSVFYAGGSQWYLATTGYWGSGGVGADGITSGPVAAPGTAAATSPGQGTYNAGSWAYPQSFASSGDGEGYWVDVEVTLAS
jgi:Domain of unknown function (DUF4082)